MESSIIESRKKSTKPKCSDLGNRSGDPQSLNGFKFIIPTDIAEEYYHHIIQIEVVPIKSIKKVPIQWKLLGESGSALPLVFFNGSLDTREFTLRVDDNGTKDVYRVTCRILAYPYSLPSPRSEFKSFDKFQIFADYSNHSIFDARIRYRKLKSELWSLVDDSRIITISDKNDIYEVQAFYENNGVAFLCSPILIVEKHWEKFNMKSHCNINLEELSLKKIFRAKINFQQSDLIATIRLKNYNNSNAISDSKDIILQKQDESEMYWGISKYYTFFTSPVLPPGQYQFTLLTKQLNLSFAQEITVLDDSKQVWPKILGSNVDQARFFSAITEIRIDCDYYGGDVEVPYNFYRTLLLFSNGQFKFDKTENSQNSVYNTANKSEHGFSGRFKIIEESPSRSILGLYLEAKRRGESNFTARPSLSVQSSKENVDDRDAAPAVFLPEIINKISLTLVGRDRHQLRLVCKKWLNAIPSNIIAVITNNQCIINDWDLILNKT